MRVTIIVVTWKILGIQYLETGLQNQKLNMFKMIKKQGFEQYLWLLNYHVYIEGNICDIIYLGVVNRLKQNDYNSWCGLFWLYYLCQLFSSLMYLYQKTKERPHNSFLWLDFPNRLSCQMVYYFCHVISKYRIFLIFSTYAFR